MTHHKWIHSVVDPNFFAAEAKVCELIVYEDENKHFYFFGNGVFFCLGDELPHVALQRLVPKEEQHTVPLGTGIFLNESTVSRLAHGHFARWFEKYLTDCKSNHPPFGCPN